MSQKKTDECRERQDVPFLIMLSLADYTRMNDLDPESINLLLNQTPDIDRTLMGSACRAR